MATALSSCISAKAQFFTTIIFFTLLSNSCKKEEKIAPNKYLDAAIFCTNEGYGLFTNMPLSFSVDAAYNKMWSPVLPGTNDSFYWSFGDGTTSTSHSPQHTYAAAGTYTVSVTFNGYESSRKYLSIHVKDAPNIAAFASIPGTKKWHGNRTIIGPTSTSTQAITDSFEVKLINNITIVAKGDTFKYQDFRNNYHYFYNNYLIHPATGVTLSYKYIEYYPVGDSMHYKYLPYSIDGNEPRYDLVTP